MKLIFDYKFRSYTSKMNEICLHCHWLYFSSITMSFGQGEYTQFWNKRIEKSPQPKSCYSLPKLGLSMPVVNCNTEDTIISTNNITKKTIRYLFHLWWESTSVPLKKIVPCGGIYTLCLYHYFYGKLLFHITNSSCQIMRHITY